MNPVGLLIGLLAGLALLLVIAGLTPQTAREASTPARPNPLARARAAASTRLGRADLIRLAAGAAGGLLVTVFTGWFAALPIIPLLVWGLPKLLAAPATTRIDQLEALEEWTRRLASLIQTGQHLTETLIASLRSCPPQIHAPVELLVARLQAGQRPDRALYSFADDIDDETSDLIAAALIRGSTETGESLGRILNDLADMVSHEVYMRRQVHTAQQQPRSEIRLIAIIAIALMAPLLLLPYGAFYRSPLGQLVLIALTGLFAAMLWWMRVIATPTPIPRFLTRPGKVGGTR